MERGAEFGRDEGELGPRDRSVREGEHVGSCQHEDDGAIGLRRRRGELVLAQLDEARVRLQTDCVPIPRHHRGIQSCHGAARNF